jgi:hypothetical protein
METMLINEIQQARTRRQAEEKVAARTMVTEGHLALAAGNVSEMEQASMGRMPVTRVAPATTSITVGRIGSCTLFFHLSFFRSRARSTGHTIVTTASAKERQRLLNSTYIRKKIHVWTLVRVTTGRLLFPRKKKVRAQNKISIKKR